VSPVVHGVVSITAGTFVRAAMAAAVGSLVTAGADSREAAANASSSAPMEPAILPAAATDAAVGAAVNSVVRPAMGAHGATADELADFAALFARSAALMSVGVQTVS